VARLGVVSNPLGQTELIEPSLGAIIAHCALKANAQSIYTWKRFNRLGETIAGRVRQP
jgi:hypothetical protein